MLARSDVADRIQYGLVKYVKKAKMVLKVPRSKKETNSITHATGDSRPIQAMVPEGEEGCVSVIIVPADTLKPKILTAFVPQVTGNGITIGTSTTEVFTIDRGPSWPAASNEIIANIHQSIKNISLSFVKGTSIPQTPATAASRSVLQQEKARARVGKYGLNLEPHGCPARGAIGVRVEKPIRSRIHRQCHRCESNFGRDKTCLNCAHKRCTKCPRYPFKESKIKTGPQEALSAPGDIEVSGLEVERRVVEELEVEKVEPVVKEPEITKLDVENLTITPIPILPVITSPANNGDSDLVHKPISQQVHRICHKCETEFFLEEKICAYCGHLRCKSCARDPPQPDRHSNAYFNDDDPESEKEVGSQPDSYVPPTRVFKKIRRRIRWTCHACSTLYYEKSKVCSSCQHKRCRKCFRDPTKRVKPVPSSELLKSIENQLEHLSVSPQSVLLSGS